MFFEIVGSALLGGLACGLAAGTFTYWALSALMMPAIAKFKPDDIEGSEQNE
jgi:hypothetical protein